MIYLIFAIILILFLPIYLSSKLVLDLSAKRIYYSVKLFSAIKINSGYITFLKNGVKISLSNLKNKQFKYKQFLFGDTDVNFFNYLKLTEFKSITLIGGENDFQNFLFCNFITTFQSILFSILKENNKIVKATNDIYIFAQKPKFQVVANLTAKTTVFKIIIVSIKNIYGGILNYVKGKKGQQN